MQLYLSQHAKAMPKDEDPTRPLTAEGRREAEAVARFLAPLSLPIDQIWHSGKLRAAQTAETYANAVATTGAPTTRTGLGPGDNVTPIRDELAVASESIMLVGHMPFVSRLASLLLTGYESPPIVAFVNAGVVCLGRTADNCWQVEWTVTPKLLGL